MPKRPFFYAAIAFYIASFMLSLPFPNDMNVYATLSVLTVPLYTTDGIYMQGVGSILFLVASIFCFVQSVEKFKAAAAIIPLVVYLVLPSIAIPMYQAYFAEGMYALSYEEEQSGCQLTALSEAELQLYCELNMQNYSDEDVTAQVEFIQTKESAFNGQAPYTITVPANIEGIVTVDEKLVNEAAQLPYTATLNDMSIRLMEGDKKRTM